MNSDTCRDDGDSVRSRRSCTLPGKRSVKFLLDSQPIRKFDSVDSIMDKIDGELSKVQLPPVANRLSTHKYQRSRSLSSSRQSNQYSKAHLTKDKNISEADLIYKSLDISKIQNNKDAMFVQPDGATKSLTLSDISNNNWGPTANPGSLSRHQLRQDLTSAGITLGAQSDKASDLLLSQPPCIYYPVHSDGNSVCTEDFESAFLRSVETTEQTAGATFKDTDSVKSVDTPRTEDFEDVFQSTLVSQPPNTTLASLPNPRQNISTAINVLQGEIINPGLRSVANSGSSNIAAMNGSRGNLSSQKSTLCESSYDASSESEFDGELAKEIREESCRIQKEIELERKTNKLKQQTPTKSVSISSRDSTPSTVIGVGDTQVSNSLLGDEPLDAKDREIVSRLNDEKLRLLCDIGTLKKNLGQLQQNVRATDQQIKDNRIKAEEARSQVMIAEFKRGEALKEFTELSHELERGRKLYEAVRVDAQKLEDKANVSISKEELSDLFSERDQLRALLDNRNSTVNVEKNELELQLNGCKEELFSQKRQHREEVEKLEEHIETLKLELSRAATEKETRALEADSVRTKVEKLERQLRESEKTNLNAIIERDKELEILKESAQRDTFELRIHLNNELCNTKKMLKITEEKSVQLQNELHDRDVLIQDLRDECLKLQNKASDEEESHDKVIRDLQKQLQMLEQLKNEEIQTVKQQMEVEQIGFLDSNKVEMEQLHQAELLAVKEEFNLQMMQQQQLINGKDEEICLLRSRLNQQEDAAKKLAERLKADCKLQLEQAIQNQKEMWEKEHRHVELSHLRQIKEEAEKEKEVLREELESEQRRCRQLDDQFNALKMELEQERQKNQKLYQEKLVAASKSKQMAQEELSLQVEKIRQQMEEDTERVLDRLKEEMSNKDEEIRCLRTECNNLQQLEADASITIQKLEKMIVGEINDECRRTAHLLGVTPRKSQTSGVNDSPSQANHRKVRSVAASAIANLRACNEELRNTVKELKEDVESLKAALHKAKKSKDVEMEEVKKRFTKDSHHDMEELKNRLTQIVSTQQSVLDLLEISPASLLEPDAHSTDIDSEESEIEHKEQIDHICSLLSDQNAYNRLVKMREQQLKDVPQHVFATKDEVANMADRFSEELHNQLKLYTARLDHRVDDRSFNRSLRESTLRNNENQLDHDLGASPNLRQNVTERIKQLRAGSPSRKSLTSSSPDLSRNDGFPTALEQRVKLAELKAHLAEERASRNQTLLNQKLQELNQLQNVLNSQTKEIISLERSFEEMKHPTSSPIKSFNSS